MHAFSANQKNFVVFLNLLNVIIQKLEKTIIYF